MNGYLLHYPILRWTVVSTLTTGLVSPPVPTQNLCWLHSLQVGHETVFYCGFVGCILLWFRPPTATHGGGKFLWWRQRPIPHSSVDHSVDCDYRGAEFCFEHFKVTGSAWHRKKLVCCQGAMGIWMLWESFACLGHVNVCGKTHKPLAAVWYERWTFTLLICYIRSYCSGNEWTSRLAAVVLPLHLLWISKWWAWYSPLVWWAEIHAIRSRCGTSGPHPGWTEILLVLDSC